MSLTGLFLIIFLVVHLAGNLQLLAADGGKSFNEYAHFMTSNPLVKTISYGLYFLILLHTVQGLLIAWHNRTARSQRYAVKNTTSSTFASRNMASMGIVIFIFLLIHLYQFWLQMKLGNLDLVNYGGGEPVRDLYAIVAYTYSQWWYVVFYVVAMVFVGLHLFHGFQSAFQTLGLQHKKYTPAINWVGKLYSIGVPLGFAVIPIVFFLKS